MKEWDDSERTTISLSIPVTIVLFDWLMTVDLDTVPVTHKGQKQALMGLLNALEGQTQAIHATKDETASATERVARDMGW